MEKLWFKRKRYGWGWTPATWQGWLVTAFYIVSILFVANNGKFFTTTSDIVIGIVIPIVMFTILLFVVTWAKGEKPKWQWGNSDKKDL